MPNLNRRELAASVAATALVASAPGSAKARGEITRTNAAIHQEIRFSAAPARVYRALTVSDEFDRMVQLSDAMTGAMKAKLGNAPATVDAQAGGAFQAFGGYISGRTIELVPDTRLVQAWRTGSWKPGVYSIARFDFAADGDGTHVVFDHTGFPNADAAHLAKGWYLNYWQPLAKYLAL